MSTKQFIDQLIAGENAEAKDTIENVLSAKAFEALDEYKKAMATSIFGTVSETVKEEVDHQNTKMIAKHGDIEVHSHSPDDEGSVTSVRKNGKEIASGDFDRGANSFFISHKSFGKGQKHFKTAKDIAHHFSNMKEEVELDEEQLDEKDELGDRGGTGSLYWSSKVKRAHDPDDKRTRLEPRNKETPYRVASAKPEYTKSKIMARKAAGGITGPKGKLPEEVEVKK